MVHKEPGWENVVGTPLGRATKLRLVGWSWSAGRLPITPLQLL